MFNCCRCIIIFLSCILRYAFPSNDSTCINKLLLQYQRLPTASYTQKLKLLDSASQYAIANNNLNQQFSVLKLTATLLQSKPDLVALEKTLFHLQQIAQLTKDTSQLLFVYYRLGRFYFQKQVYTKALNYFYASLRLNNKKQFNFQSDALICTNIAQVYMAKASISNSLFEYQKAEEFLSRSLTDLKRTDTLKISDLIIPVLNDYGNVMRQKGLLTNDKSCFIKALSYYTLALVKSKNENSGGDAVIETNIGNIHFQLGNYELAMHYYNLALNKKLNSQHIKSSSSTLTKIAELYLAKFQKSKNHNNYDQSLKYATMALDTAIKYVDINMQLHIYRTLSIICEQGKNFSKSLLYYKAYTHLNDSLIDQKNVQMATRLQGDLQQSQNQKKIDDLLLRQKLAQMQIDKQHNYNFLLLIFVIVLVLGITAILIAFSGRKKINQQLALKNKEILLRKQITPHFLFNMFNNLYVTTLKAPQLASEMVLGLADVMRYQLKEINNPKAELVNEMEYVKNLLLLEQTLKPGLDVKIDFNEHEAKGIYVEPLIYTSLVENAIKHGAHNSENGYVRISTQVRQNLVSFHIKNSIPSEKINALVSGTGLKNLSERLELTYKNNYNIITTKTENEYSVQLILKIK